jgi:hypothetical protein
MKKKLVTLALIFAFSFIALPIGGSDANAQRRSYGDRDRYSSYYGRQRYRDSYYGRDRRWSRGKKKRYYGYKNYGQYRRTQVGNRRYRYERRYYWRDGSRLSRLIRVFY